MKRFVTLALLGLTAPIAGALMIAPTTAVAAEAQTLIFAIENMTCALCPITVKTAMEKVAGVQSVIIDFDAKTATVAFDPTVTDAATIANASTNAGYPAQVKA